MAFMRVGNIIRFFLFAKLTSYDPIGPKETVQLTNNLFAEERKVSVTGVDRKNGILCMS